MAMILLGLYLMLNAIRSALPISKPITLWIVVEIIEFVAGALILLAALGR